MNYKTEQRYRRSTTILNAKHVDGTPYGFNDVAEGVGAAVAGEYGQEKLADAADWRP
jgi:hypothetical protein